MNQQHFAEQAEQLKSKLYRMAFLYLGNQQDALDAVDDAVYKGFKNCQTLRQEEFFATWLTRILINTCYNDLRRKKREQPLDVLPENAGMPYDALPLNDAVSRLPKELKDIVILRYFADLTLEETARALNIPRGTVTTRQKKALALLRLELEEEESL